MRVLRLSHEDLPSRRTLRLLTILIVFEAVYLVILGWKLPRHYVAAHWDFAWVGIDLMEVAALVGVVVSAARRHRSFNLFTAVAGTLFLVDAWFDVTAARRATVWGSWAEAVAEVPFALVLWWWSYHTPDLSPRGDVVVTVGE